MGEITPKNDGNVGSRGGGYTSNVPGSKLPLFPPARLARGAGTGRRDCPVNARL